MSKKQPEAQPVAWMQIGVGPNQGTRMVRFEMPKHYNKDWWQLYPLYASPPVQAEQPDLSALRPETQKAVRGWIADGTFVQRAIAVIDSQEKELMQYEQAVRQSEPSDEAIDLLAQQEGLLPDFGDLAEPNAAATYMWNKVAMLRRFARAVLALNKEKNHDRP